MIVGLLKWRPVSAGAFDRILQALCGLAVLLLILAVGSIGLAKPDLALSRFLLGITVVFLLAIQFVIVLELLGVLRTSRPAFAKYLYARLGPGSRRQCLGQMFSRSFGAPDFTRFWRHWNPFVGYFLAYFCFAPLRRFAPRPLCLIVTFALNGLLHDLVYVWPWGFAQSERLPFPFPVFTLCLVMIVVIILAAERLRFTFAHLSWRRRVACHLLALVGPFAVSIGLLLLTRV